MLYRSLSEDLVEILVGSWLRGPCMKSLQMPCIRGACMTALLGCSWEVLVSRFCKTLSSSSRSFSDGPVGFSSGSWHEALVEILVNPLRGPCGLRDLYAIIVIAMVWALPWEVWVAILTCVPGWFCRYSEPGLQSAGSSNSRFPFASRRPPSWCSGCRRVQHLGFNKW